MTCNYKTLRSIDFLGGDNSRFGAEDVTINIISVNDKNVSGNFSGKFKADSNDDCATLNITDGSFDLPFEKN